MSQAPRGTSSARVKAAPRTQGVDYITLSRRPLHSLVVLSVLVFVYELLSLQYLTNADKGTQQVIKAENLIGRVFDVFGVTGLLVPGLALLTVLFVWHVISKERWQVRVPVLVGMVVESVLWALPLLVLGAVVQRFRLTLFGAPAAAIEPGMFTDAAQFVLAGGQAPAKLTALPWQARIAISLGAGLYEEMVFRLIAIAGIHVVVRDIMSLGPKTSNTIAVVASALAFALYHDVHTAASGLSFIESIRWGDLTFFFLAGAYFSILYLSRGFGIVVLCHAAYDMIVLLGGW